jgi:hypothetical protein
MPKVLLYSRRLGRSAPLEALALDAQDHHDVGALERGLEAIEDLHAVAAHVAGRSVRGPARSAPRSRRARAGARSSARRASAARRRRSPRPASSVPLARRIVNASRSACVGCSWAPSPAFTTAAAHALGDVLRGAGAAVADDDHVGRIASSVLHVSRGSRPCDAGGETSRCSRRRPRGACPRARSSCACGSRPRRRG